MYSVGSHNAQNIFSSSPAKLNKCLTPKHTYSLDSSSKIPTTGVLVFNDSPALSISPKTKSWVSELIDLPNPPKTQRSLCAGKKTEYIFKLKKLLKKKQSTIRRLKNISLKSKNKKVNISEFFKTTNFPSANSRSLMAMQILHKKRRPWSKVQKNFSLSLYYKSPSTYTYLRKNGITLPGESTIRRWLNSIKFCTGFSENYMEQLKLKMSDMVYEEKKCVILLDEVHIMKAIEYNKILDEIEGYEDLGTFGRFNKISSVALVIMVRGLYNKWKIPISYYFTGNGIKGNTLLDILKESVSKIINIGLLPICIICDQGTQNRRMFTLLGGTADNPTTEICGKKLFLIYDMPHLVKSLRNNLLTGDFKFGDKIVSINDIKKTYDLDSTNTTARAMCKITPQHLNPNPFQKMSCKLAIQLFSNSVSSTIKTCISTGQLKSTTAKNTSEFIKLINNMFDSANSKNLFDPNPHKRPMSAGNPTVFDNLKKVRSIFKEAVKVCHKNKNTSTPPCFVGVIWTITAILELYDHEKLDMMSYRPDKLFFLMTNRLTQDVLENLFSIMRQKNGYNRNPTARVFRCCFGHICSYSLMKCSSTCNNCEPDDDEFLTVNVLNDLTEIHPSPIEEVDISTEEIQHETHSSDTSSSSFENSTSTLIPKLTLEMCAINYFAGYLAKKCYEKFNCAECKINLIETNTNLTDERQLLIIHKTYDNIESTQGLKGPSEKLVQIVEICLNVFKNKFSSIKFKKNILDQLLSEAKNKINLKYSIFNSGKCEEHYLYIIKHLLTTKIFKECKWENSYIGVKRDHQNKAKLRILENK